MRKQELFIAFSDIQVEDWQRFSKDHSRLYDNFKAMEVVGSHANGIKVPVLFAGDFFDNPKELSNLLISKTYQKYKECFRFTPFFAISGNHDQSESNTPNNSSPSHLELYDHAFDNFHLLDGKSEYLGGLAIHGIPYLKSNKGFVEAVKKTRKKIRKNFKNILLIHTDFHNIKYDNQRSSGTVENLPRYLNKLFKGFDLVLSGHIHKPQVIRKNIIMLGATHHQRISDVGIEMGYWVFYTDLSYDFIPLDLPQFKRGKDKKDGHFYVPKKITKVKDQVSTTESFTSTNLNKLAKNYLIATNNKNKTKLKYLAKYLEDGFTQ